MDQDRTQGHSEAAGLSEGEETHGGERGDVSRPEFDALVARVNRIDQTLEATVEMVAGELVGLRAHVDERFEHLHERFEAIDDRFEAMKEKLNAYGQRTALYAADTGGDRHERFMQAIADRFGIDIEES